MSVMVQYMSTFIAALAVGFYRRWELALLLTGIVPFMALGGALFARVSFYVILLGNLVVCAVRVVTLVLIPMYISSSVNRAFDEPV